MTPPATESRQRVGLWKISYVSVAAEGDEIAQTSVLAIVAVAEKHNARFGITGMLTFHAGRFAQVIEGPEWQVRLLMRRIRADPRHHSLQVVVDRPIAERQYPQWSMAYRDPKDFVRDELAGVVEQARLLSEAMRETKH